MGLFLFRFWPALLPLIIYLAWYWLKARSAVKNGRPRPEFRGSGLYWAIILSLAAAALCFLAIAAGIKPEKGEYVPPQIKDGALVPGHVE